MEPILKIVADNPALIKALQDVLIGELDTLPEGAEGFSDEQLGQIARARIAGQKAIKDTFVKIQRLKSGEVKRVSVNPAR